MALQVDCGARLSQDPGWGSPPPPPPERGGCPFSRPSRGPLVSLFLGPGGGGLLGGALSGWLSPWNGGGARPGARGGGPPPPPRERGCLPLLRPVRVSACSCVVGTWEQGCVDLACLGVCWGDTQML